MRRSFLSVFLKCLRRDREREGIDGDRPQATADGTSRAIPTSSSECLHGSLEIPRETQEMIDRFESEAAMRAGLWLGPLRTEKAPRGDGGEDWAIVDGVGKVIGVAYGRVGEQDSRPAAGNAALWAAAPDILLTLRMIITQMDRFGDWQDGEFYYKGVPCPEFRSMIEVARKVLGEAGRTSV